MFKLEVIGNKICLVGKSFPFKEKIKACGGKWEKTVKMWWWENTTANIATVRALVHELNQPPKEPEEITIIGLE